MAGIGQRIDVDHVASSGDTNDFTQGDSKITNPHTVVLVPVDKVDALDLTAVPIRTDPKSTNELRGLSSNVSVPDAQLVNTAAYHQATPAVREQMLNAYHHVQKNGTATDVQAFFQITASPFWSQADDGQRLQMLNLCQTVEPRELDTASEAQGTGVTRPMVALAGLATRQLNGRSVLLDRAYAGANAGPNDGKTLIELLCSTQVGISVRWQTGLSASAIVSGMILEIHDPGRLDQGLGSTCGAASLQINLVHRNPAEYARLCAGLLSDGSVAMRNGDTLTRHEQSISPTPSDLRTPTERIFQSAIMEYANPYTEYYVDPNIDPSKGSPDYQRKQVGSKLDELPTWAKVLAWVTILPGIILSLWPSYAKEHFGLVPVSWSGPNGEEVNEIERVNSAIWGTRAEYIPRSRDEQFGNLMSELSDTHRYPRGDLSGIHPQALFHWGTSGNHYVSMLAIDPPGTKPRLVHFQNPFRSFDAEHQPQAGQQVFRAPAGMTWENPQQGTMTMPYDTFTATVEFVVVPKSRPSISQ
jgi:hypothetical protein